MTFRAITVFLLGCCVSLAADIKDPLLRTGVWQAIATIKERPVRLLLNLQIEATGETRDRTVTISNVRGRISSAEFGMAPSGIGCFLSKEDVELDDQHVWATCINISDKTTITLLGAFDPDGQGLTAVLTHSGTIPAHFERILIDETSPLDGEWIGEKMYGRESTLHARTFNGAPVVTLDRWQFHSGSWGWLVDLQAGKGGITFTPSGTCCGWFYGQLSPDTEQITGTYSGGQFASSRFARVPKK